jgi:hypothetical protein
MHLSEHDLLELWAAAETQHPIDRALSALAFASGERRGALAELPLGERDARLFRLYRGLSGRTIPAIARCPACGEPAELVMAVDDLCPDPGATAGEVVVERDGVVVRCRQPTSRDLAAATRAVDEEAARAGLIAASLVSAHAGERALAAADLDGGMIACIEDALAAMAPPVEIELDVTCPGCGAAWSAPFDIAEVVWTAAEVAARRAMDTIADLARTYGWTEQEVLALPPARRRYYQERA